ncbi:DUF4185 domain-containing protein [Propionibacteriaceae bacterium Y1685]
MPLGPCDHQSPSPETGRRKLSRRGLIGGAAAASLAGAGLTTVGSSATAHAASDPVVIDGLTITRIKDLTGPRITGRFGVHWTDLGIPGRCPDGRTFYVFGDTFGPTWGENWRSPVGLWSRTTDVEKGVRFSGTPGRRWARQLIPYEHDENNISTIIPSDVITLGDTMYLHAVVNRGFGNVIWSGIWTSQDNGDTWQDSGARFPADKYGGRWQLAAWDLGDDGWVYVLTSKFLRVTTPILHRVRPEDITHPDAYIPWGPDADGVWGWGNDAEPVLDRITGEASLKQLGDRWLLTWFSPEGYSIEAQVLDHPTDITETKIITLLKGVNWGEESNVAEIPQLYGSYVIPGSTLADTHLTVSQWNTGDNSIYHVMQYRIQGLDQHEAD